MRITTNAAVVVVVVVVAVEAEMEVVVGLAVVVAVEGEAGQVLQKPFSFLLMVDMPGNSSSRLNSKWTSSSLLFSFFLASTVLGVAAAPRWPS
jgi:hypothetical protein